jgi:transposase
VLAPRMFDASMNPERLVERLGALRREMRGGQVLVLDNCRVHHSRTVREWLEEYPMKVVFLPPPVTQNPIELLWRRLKAKLRRMRMRGLSQVREHLRQWLDEFVRESARNSKFTAVIRSVHDG